MILIENFRFHNIKNQRIYKKIRKLAKVPNNMRIIFEEGIYCIMCEKFRISISQRGNTQENRDFIINFGISGKIGDKIKNFI